MNCSPLWTLASGRLLLTAYCSLLANGPMQRIARKINPQINLVCGQLLPCRTRRAHPTHPVARAAYSSPRTVPLRPTVRQSSPTTKGPPHSGRLQRTVNSEPTGQPPALSCRRALSGVPLWLGRFGCLSSAGRASRVASWPPGRAHVISIGGVQRSPQQAARSKHTSTVTIDSYRARQR